MFLEQNTPSVDLPTLNSSDVFFYPPETLPTGFSTDVKLHRRFSLPTLISTDVKTSAESTILLACNFTEHQVWLIEQWNEILRLHTKVIWSLWPLKIKFTEFHHPTPKFRGLPLPMWLKCLLFLCRKGNMVSNYYMPYLLPLFREKKTVTLKQTEELNNPLGRRRINNVEFI